MKKATILLVVLFFVLAGCASLQGLRAHPPTRTEIYNGNYKDIANCVVERLDDNGDMGIPNLRINEKKRRAKIFKVLEPSGAAIYEFELMQIDDLRFKAESWGMATIWGRELQPNRIWPFLEKCVNK